MTAPTVPMRTLCSTCIRELEPGEVVTVRQRWQGQREYDVPYCPSCAATLQPAPLRMLELCAGIGAMSYVWQYILGQVVAGQVELDEYCLAVLEKNFPGVPRKRDLYEVVGDEFGPIDLLTAGFPCQPVSRSGQRRGDADARWLWGEVYRVIQRAQPAWVLCENVDNLVNLGLDDVLADLDCAGYETWALLLPAAAVGAPHKRERIFIIGYLVGHADRGRSAQWREPESGWDTLSLAQRRGPDPRRSGAHLADADGVAAARECGDVAGEAGTGARGPAQRRRVRDAARHRGAVVADAEGECEREPHDEADALPAEQQAPARAVSRRRSRASAGASDELADPHDAGFQGHGSGLGSARGAGRDYRDAPADGREGSAESGVGLFASGFPTRLDPSGLEAKAEAEEVDATIEEAGSAEGMQAMRQAIGAEAIQRAAGGLGCVSASAVLRPSMHGSVQSQSGRIAGRSTKTSSEVQRHGVPAVRSDGRFTCSPPRLRPGEQHDIESDDVVQLLSRDMALAAWQDAVEATVGLHNLRAACAEIGHVPETLSALQEVWRSLPEQTAHWVAVRATGRTPWPAGPGQRQLPYEPPRTVTESAPNHNAALRALGNAIVPQQVAPVLAAILDAAREERRQLR